MAWLRAFGSALPARVLTNAELAPMVGADPAWILEVSGIGERRLAAPGDTVATLGAAAGATTHAEKLLLAFGADGNYQATAIG